MSASYKFLKQKLTYRLICMRIVRIFENKLLSFQFEGETENEYDRLMSQWTDPSYLRSFLKENFEDLPSGSTISELAGWIYEDSEKLDRALLRIVKGSGQKMETFFKPLDNKEYQIRSLSKQKVRKNYLRLYAIRIDEDCFVITGGAIKLTHLMQDRRHTAKELAKIDKARLFLKEQGVSDSDSFFEFLIEHQDEQ